MDAIVTHSQEGHKDIAQKEVLRLILKGFSRSDHIGARTRKKQLAHV